MPNYEDNGIDLLNEGPGDSPSASNDFDVEADEEGNLRAAPPVQEEEELPKITAVPIAPKKKAGRPKGPAAVGVAAPPVAVAAPQDSYESRDPMSLCGQVMAQQKARGVAPAGTRITIIRVSSGAYSRGPEEMYPVISGEELVIDDQTPPGEVLQNRIIDVYHHNSGPAVYKVKFTDRHTGRVLKVSDPMPLDAYVNIAARRHQQQSMGVGAPQVAPSYPFPQTNPYWPPQRGGFPVGFGYQTQQPSPPPPAAAMPPPAPASMDPAARQMYEQMREGFARMQGMVEEERRHRQEAERVASQPVPPPAVSEEERMARVSAATAKAVVESLMAAGVISKPGQIGLGAPQVPPTPAQPPLQAAAQVNDAFSSVEQLISGFEKFDKVRGRLRDLFAGPEKQEPETPEALAEVVPDEPPFKPQIVPLSNFLGEELKWVGAPNAEDGGSYVEWAMQMAMLNPKRAGALLEKAASSLTEGPLGQLIMKFMGQGGELAAAAVAHQNGVAQVMPPGNGGGWSPSS